MKQCPQCKQCVDDSSAFCNNCGYNFTTDAQSTPPPYSYPSDNAFDSCGPEGKSRGVAALLAILLGYLGIHYFYLGKNMAGVLSIILSFITCGIWPVVMLIQGILMFCMTNAQFREKYVITPSSFPVF